MHPVAFVFHELRSPENLGSIARAMNNFGLRELVLSAPLTYAFGEAEKLAVKSADLLEKMRIERELPAALGPYAFVAGTTSRELSDRPALDGPGLAARLSQERARGKVAVLFGGEKRGLSDAELDLCQAVVRIPTHAAQPSMNVAQCATVLAYELSRSVAAPVPAPAPGARRELMERLYAQMKQALLRADYLNPQNPSDILDELRRLIDRTEPTEREAKLLLTLFRKLDIALRRG